MLSPLGDWSNEQLSGAVSCYLQIRQAVLDDWPQAEKEAQTLADRAPTDIEVRRQWTSLECWGILWHLPFYSGKKTEVIEKQVSAIRAHGCFNDFDALAGGMGAPSHPWYVEKIGVHCHARGAEVRAFCEKTGRYDALPYKTPAHAIRRVIRLATLFREWKQEQEKNNLPFIDVMTGGDLQPFPRSVFNALAGVVGKITALHALTDLGFPCVKPDIWISRITTYCGWLPGYTADDVVKNRRGAWDLLFKRCAEVAAAASEQVPSRNALRELDYLMARYGMIFQPTADDIGPYGPAKKLTHD